MDMNIVWVANFGTLRFFSLLPFLDFIYILKSEGKEEERRKRKERRFFFGCLCIYIYIYIYIYANFCTIASLVWRDERVVELYVKCSHVNILENRMERSDLQV